MVDGKDTARFGFVVFRPDGTQASGECKMPAEGSRWRDLANVIRPLLDGADFEHVRVFHEGEYRDMFVDEIGQLKGLPRNERATEIYRCNVLTHEIPPPDPESLPDVVGSAVLFDKPVWT